MVCSVIGACSVFRSGEKLEQRIEPNFDYNPTEAVAGNTGITFAAVGSQFEIPFGQTAVPLFERFASNMADDFGEIITARGYTLRGPFRTFDEMTFIDKDNSNLILTAKVDFQSDLSSTRIARHKAFLLIGTVGWKVSGRISVLGRITLIISESLTNEKMWTKSVNITPITVDLTPTLYNRRDITLSDLLIYDDQLYTRLGRQLDRQYHEIMNRTYGYLDPREMTLIKNQAADLRKKKTY